MPLAFAPPVIPVIPFHSTNVLSRVGAALILTTEMTVFDNYKRVPPVLDAGSRLAKAGLRRAGTAVFPRAPPAIFNLLLFIFDRGPGSARGL